MTASFTIFDAQEHPVARPFNEYLAYVEERPTEMLERQLAANRKAARTWVINETGRKWKHFSHVLPYRPHFVMEILAMRRVLRNRAADREAK